MRFIGGDTKAGITVEWSWLDGRMDGWTSCDGAWIVKSEIKGHGSHGGGRGRKTKNIPDRPLRPWEDRGGRVSRSSEGLLRYLGFNLLCSSAFPGQVKPSTPGGRFFPDSFAERKGHGMTLPSGCRFHSALSQRGCSGDVRDQYINE